MLERGVKAGGYGSLRDSKDCDGQGGRDGGGYGKMRLKREHYDGVWWEEAETQMESGRVDALERDAGILKRRRYWQSCGCVV